MNWNGNDKVFRTYFHGKKKQDKEKVRCVPAEKVKDQEGHSFEEVKNDDFFGAVLNPGYIDISFDTKEMSDAMFDILDSQSLHCLELSNPKNGHIHTYWKKPKDWKYKDGEDITLACGLVADIHSGSTFIPLCIDGTKRFPPEYDETDEDGGYDKVPKFLYPVNTNKKFWQMRAGEGRNSNLHGYILVLWTQLQMTKDEVRRMYKEIINPYILAEPLDERELDTIMRDDSFQSIENDEVVPVESFYNGRTFLTDVFSDYMIEHAHVCKINGRLHVYENGIYVYGKEKLYHKMLQYDRRLKRNNKADVYEFLWSEAPEIDDGMKPQYVAFENGIYDIINDCMMPFNPEFIITNKIPWNYNPTAYCESTDKMLDNVSSHDKDIRYLLEQFIGYCMFRSNVYQKAVILVGSGANGKSAMLRTIQAMLGKENFSTLDINALNDRFSTSLMYEKLANIGDDISDEFLHGNQVATFKKVVTGDRIKAEDKGVEPYEFNPYAKLIFSCNDMPRIRDRSGAVKRRLIMIPFNAKFSPDDKDYDPHIEDKVQTRESIEYLIRISLNAFRDVIKENKFHESSATNETLKSYDTENNPIIGFVTELDEGVHPDDPWKTLIGQPVRVTYDKYIHYCDSSGIHRMTISTFSKQLSLLYGIKSSVSIIDGKSHRVYTKEKQ